MIKVLIKATGEIKRITMKEFISNRELYTNDLEWKEAKKVPAKKPVKKVVKKKVTKKVTEDEE